jgi:DNA polymerase I-like protein with 3'-5' exonuclease and polymerase domains
VLPNVKKAFIDIETTGLNPNTSYITLFGMKLDGEYTILRLPTASQLNDIYTHLKRYNIPVVEHNGDVFDDPYLKAKGVNESYVTIDTLLISYIAGARWETEGSKKESLDGRTGGSLSLKALAKGLLGKWDVDVVKWNGLMLLLDTYTKTPTEDVRQAVHRDLTYYGLGRYILASDVLPVAKIQAELWVILTEYLKKDLDATEYVFNKYAPLLEPHDYKIHDYLKLMRQVYKMTNSRGLYVDKVRLEKLIVKTYNKKHNLEETVKHLFSNEIVNELNHYMDDFNLNSSQQLADLLYNRMQLPIIARTPTGAPATGRAVLKRLASLNPAIGRFLEYRDVKKEHEMLSETLKKAIRADGKIYTHISVVTTKTGRTSSYNPNIQQLKRGEMRSIFIAPKGYVMVEFDYSTAEMRVAAELSKDPTLLKAFKEGRDVHKLMAARILNKAENEVTKKERQDAKAVNFGKLFGQGARGFREYAFAQYDIDFSMHDCINIHNKFHATYANLEPGYYAKVHAMAVANDGILYNLIGRKYYVGDKDFTAHVNPDGRVGIHGRIRNAAINFPVQSFANDMLLMSYAEAVGTLDGPDCVFFITVHDAMYAYIKEDPQTLDYYIKRVKAIMEKPRMLKQYFDVELEVPMVADASVGYNMYEKVDYDKWLEEVHNGTN